MNTAAMFSKTKDEWTTPQDFWEKVNAEFQFTWDVAARAENSKCGLHYFGPDHPDTRWWHGYVWSRKKHQLRAGVEVRFIKGRLKFGGAEHGAPFPSVVIVFWP